MRLPDFIQENVPLAAKTTFGVGGPARFFACPENAEQIAEAFATARGAKLPVITLGGGSNLLVADAGVEAMVVKLSGAGAFGSIRINAVDESRWSVGAAVGLQNLVAATIRSGRAGLESMAGIPGLVGGAVAMNAGASSGGVGQYVLGADVFDMESGARRYLAPPELAFSYRKSTVRGLLAVTFDMALLETAEPEALLAAFREQRERKKMSQPLAVPSAGCVFKNPPGDTAGALLDAAGCKGMSEGNARVSELHANFIVIGGPACARDIATLALRMREAVWRSAGVRLELEIALWGNDPSFAALGAA